jgi:hypothetical protein
MSDASGSKKACLLSMHMTQAFASLFWNKLVHFFRQRIRYTSFVNDLAKELSTQRAVAGKSFNLRSLLLFHPEYANPGTFFCPCHSNL